MVRYEVNICGEGQAETLEKKFKTEILLSPWNSQIVSAEVGAASRLLGSSTAIDLPFLVFSYFSGQKVNRKNHNLQAFIDLNHFQDFQF